MKKMYVTVAGFQHYAGLQPFYIGAKLHCEKEPQNPYDNEAIRVSIYPLGTVGYIANSVHTKANGTKTASGVYSQLPDSFTIQVLFTTRTKVICQVVKKKKKNKKKVRWQEIK
ncbi:MAG TPA: DNA-binding protein [Tissierellia bacterium]|nr:DNA-binding protein [Tissierellia bacterium]